MVELLRVSCNSSHYQVISGIIITMQIESTRYGKIARHGAAHLFEFHNELGLRLQCTNYEAALLSLQVPDFSKDVRSVTGKWNLEFSKALKQHPTSGAVLGRIGYSLPPPHSLVIEKREYTVAPHSEHQTFKDRMWRAALFGGSHACGVHNTLQSAEGDQGLPAEIEMGVKYTLTNQNEIIIEHTARTLKKSALSLTNHLTWNLSNGHGVLQHDAVIYAKQASDRPELSSQQSVDATDLDFQRRRVLYSKLNHYFLLGSEIATRYHPMADQPRKLKPALWLYDPKSRRYLELFTNYPLLHLAITRGQLKSESSLLVQPCLPCDSSSLILAKRTPYNYTLHYRFGVLE